MHLVQGNFSLICRCLLFTVFPFPAICSASLSGKSGRMGSTCATSSPSVQLQVLCRLPVARGDHQQGSSSSGSISHAQTLSTAFAEYFGILSSGQHCQSTLYLEQSELESCCVKLVAFTEKEIYCSASKSSMLLQNGNNGSHS